MGIFRPPSVPGAAINTSNHVFRGLKYLLKNQLLWTPRKIDFNETFQTFFIMNKFEPKLIHTIPNVLRPLLKFKEEFDVDFPDSLKYVSLGGEPISVKEFQKHLDAEIVMRYGANDVPQRIADECKEHSGLHINMENHIVEIVKDNEAVQNEGEKGEVVITDFHNFDAPLI